MRSGAGLLQGAPGRRALARDRAPRRPDLVLRHASDSTVGAVQRGGYDAISGRTAGPQPQAIPRRAGVKLFSGPRGGAASVRQTRAPGALDEPPRALSPTWSFARGGDLPAMEPPYARAFPKVKHFRVGPAKAGPVPDRLGGWLELPRQLLRRSSSTHQLDHPPPELRRVRRSALRHRGDFTSHPSLDLRRCSHGSSLATVFFRLQHKGLTTVGITSSRISDSS
jgi:hypothetical protein